MLAMLRLEDLHSLLFWTRTPQGVYKDYPLQRLSGSNSIGIRHINRLPKDRNIHIMFYKPVLDQQRNEMGR